MTFQPTSSLFTKRVADRAIDTTSTGTVESISLSEPVGPLVNTLIIGSIALDSISKIAGTTKLNDSNPGSTTTSLGGVGFNLAKACSLGLKSLSCNGSHSSSRLISIIGDDFTGDSIMGQLQSKGFDTSGIFRHKSSDCSTAQYTSIHNGDGGLMLACADMSIIEHPDFTNHILEQIERARPIQIVIDCNLTPECITSILEKSITLQTHQR